MASQSVRQCRWLVNVGAMAITAVLGEWLCLRRELQDIPLSECSKPPCPFMPLRFTNVESVPF